MESKPMTHPIIKNWYIVHRKIFDSEVTIHEEIARAKERTTITLSTERVSCQSGMPTHPVERHLHWMHLAEQDVRRATNHIRQAVDFKVQSAIGFEPTDSSELHHDIPPFLPQPKPQVCIDFGFEPTEGSA
jgi:hypothetical protein